MKKPTLEEVKKYFENAEKVKDHSGDVGFVEFEKIRHSYDGMCFDQNRFSKNWLVLWHEAKGFAEILRTKEPAYSITADQLMQLENKFTLPKLQEWFPEIFKRNITKEQAEKELNCRIID